MSSFRRGLMMIKNEKSYPIKISTISFYDKPCGLQVYLNGDLIIDKPTGHEIKAETYNFDVKKGSVLVFHPLWENIYGSGQNATGNAYIYHLIKDSDSSTNPIKIFEKNSGFAEDAEINIDDSFLKEYDGIHVIVTGEVLP